MAAMFTDCMSAGSKRFREADDQSFGPVIKAARYDAAIKQFHAALSAATNADERASAHKNVAVTAVKQAILWAADPSRRADCVARLDAAVAAFTEAWNVGRSCKHEEWLRDLRSRALECMVPQGTVLRDFTHAERRKVLEKYSVRFPIDHDAARAEFLRRYANDLFQATVLPFEEGDYKSSNWMLGSVAGPLMAGTSYARRLLPTSIQLLLEFEELGHTVHVHKGACESVMMRGAADDLKKHVLNDDEHLNMDGVYDVIDRYREAAKLASGFDLEAEAVAFSRLGDVFDKLLKNKEKAREAYHRAVQLGLALHPRDVTQTGWYMLASEWLRIAQQARQRREEEEAAELEKPAREKLAPQLEELKRESGRGAVYLLRFIYQRYPPRVEAHRKTAEEIGNISADKGTLRKAIIHYHPDKLEAEKRERMEEYVLAMEITKHVNYYYEILGKGGSA